MKVSVLMSVYNEEKYINIINTIGAIILLYMQMICFSTLTLGTISEYVITSIPYISLVCFIWGLIQLILTKKLNVWAILMELCAILALVVGKSFNQFVFGFGFLCFIKDFDKKKIYKIVFYSILSYMIIGILLCLFCQVRVFDPNDIRGNYVCLQFNSKHKFSAFYTVMILSLSYNYIEKNYIFSAILNSALVILLYILTETRAICFSAFLFPFFYYILNRFEKLRKYVKYLPILILFICIILTFTLTCSSEFCACKTCGEHLRTFKMRFVFPKFMIDEYGFKLFGYDFNLATVAYNRILNHFDNSYMYTLLQYGILSIPIFLIDILGIKENEDDPYTLSYLIVWYFIAIMLIYLQNYVVFWPVYLVFKDVESKYSIDLNKKLL